MLNLHHIRLDYLSCVLTIATTILIGKRLWHGWVVATINSVVLCVIGLRTAQFGFVPANLVCIALYVGNLFTWRFKSPSPPPISTANRVPSPSLKDASNTIPKLTLLSRSKQTT